MRQNNFKLNINENWYCYERYFQNIDFYNNYKGKKLLLYYEDILTNKKDFINTLYNFLDIDNIEKKEYVISNVDKLYYLSSQGKNRSWTPIRSNFNLDFYYKKIPQSIKSDFDNYLKEKLKKYPSLKEKFKINL